MAFGRGIHFCVGVPLARLEGRVVLGALLARTEHVALDPGRAPFRANSLVVRRFRSLHLTATCRRAQHVPDGIWTAFPEPIRVVLAVKAA